MNSLKTLKILAKLASDLDQQGLIAEADFIDYLIAQVSTGLRPIGEVYQKDGKYYRKFEDPRKGLVIKEVDSSGNLIPAPTTPIAPTSPETSFWEKYNPFAGLNSGLGGDADAAAEAQSKSKVPWIESTVSKQSP